VLGGFIYFIKLSSMKGDEFSGLVFYDKKGVTYSKNEAQLIAENIKRIITTRPGERVGEPEFGSNVLTYLFMPQVYIKDVIAEIISSVNKQEPRVTVNSCTLKSAGQDDVIHINLDITLNTESKENLEIGVAI
jgi:phage baseplate assembly protein W